MERGEDLEEILISIHASVKEATREWRTRPNVIFISIHASVKEATQVVHDIHKRFHYFNSRLREGGDETASLGVQDQHISIHASVKEATKARER